jgi:hypothetical protein
MIFPVDINEAFEVDDHGAVQPEKAETGLARFSSLRVEIFQLPSPTPNNGSSLKTCQERFQHVDRLKKGEQRYHHQSGVRDPNAIAEKSIVPFRAGLQFPAGKQEQESCQIEQRQSEEFRSVGVPRIQVWREHRYETVCN